MVMVRVSVGIRDAFRFRVRVIVRVSLMVSKL